MKPYESYKKTDQLWLQDVPSHWKMIKTKYLFDERTEKGYPDEPLLVASQNMGVVPKGIYGNRTVEATKDLHLLKLVKIGDFVISLRSFQGGIEYAYYQGIISPAYTIMVPQNDISTGFFRHLAKSKSFIELLQLCVTGIREGQNIDYVKLKNFRLPVPPRAEQDQIVRFLDWKISKINKLIKAKKEQIVLLNEKKQSIINKAITKGLDDTVPMKDSGVGWIGLIPFNWKIEKIKNHFKIQKRIAGKEGYDVLSVTQNGIRIKDISKNEGQMAMNYSGYQFVHPEDFVMNHMDLLTGYVDCSSVFGVTSPDYRVFKLVNFEKCMKEYVLFIFQLCYKRKIFYGLGQGAAAQGRWRLPKDNFYNFTFPLPPLNEQQKIVTEINGNVMGIEKALNAITVELEYIMEYKTALISSVVTGKVDVGDVVVPDFEVEDEVLEDELETFCDEIEASEVEE